MALYILSFALFLNFSAFGIEVQETHCHPDDLNESEVLGYSDFRFGQDMEEMTQRYQRLYNSKKRLKDRAFFEDEKVYAWFRNLNGDKRKKFELSTRLVEALRFHIESALSRGLARFVFFSDMGHTHLLIPQKLYEEKYEALSDYKTRDQFYSQLSFEPSLRWLFHTAEQLKMTEKTEQGHVPLTPELGYRYQTRNLIGQNKKDSQILMALEPDRRFFNTVREYSGHRFWAGFYISANRNGCFKFHVNGQDQYFDITFAEYPIGSGSNDSF